MFHHHVDEIQIINSFGVVMGFDAGIVHHNDVIISAMASQITSLTIVYSAVYFGADQSADQNPKSPRHLPLWKEFTSDR